MSQYKSRPLHGHSCFPPTIEVCRLQATIAASSVASLPLPKRQIGMPWYTNRFVYPQCHSAKPQGPNATRTLPAPAHATQIASQSRQSTSQPSRPAKSPQTPFPNLQQRFSSDHNWEGSAHPIMR